MSSTRFFLDGERVNAQQIQNLSAEELARVESFNQMIGGSGEEEGEKKPDTITIVLSDQASEKMHFKVKKETKFQKVFDAYATRLGVPTTSLTFRFDGERITGENTPKMLEMEDEDMIEVLMQQVGGW